MTSVIRQFQVDATMTGTESESLALQQLMSRISQDQIVPLLETVLERYAPEQDHWYFERLMLDLGSIQFDRLENDLAAKVAECLEQLLQSQRQASSANHFSVTDDSGRSQKQSFTVAAEQALLFFLVNGRLPWSFPLDVGDTLESVLLTAWRQDGEVVQSKGATQHKFHAAIIELLQSSDVRRRLFSQFSAVFCRTLLLRLSSEAKQLVDGVNGKLVEFDAPGTEKTNFVGHLTEALFESVASQTPITDKIIWKCWDEIKASIPEHQRGRWLAWLISHWPIAVKDGATDLETGSKETVTRLLKEDVSQTAKLGGEADSSQMTSRSFDSFNETDRQFSVNHEGLEILADDKLNEGIFVGNAGLVLLHPFLAQLFQALGITESEVLLQPVRALVLLHYLATGQITAPEYELVLSKLLCNVPLNEPVASLLELTSDEIQEADALLAAVIRHWDALGDTSIDSLRGTFLLRPGKVSRRKDGDWLLQVESRSFDILLNQLPWGISMFQLPWMQQLCWVEWHYESER